MPLLSNKNIPVNERLIVALDMDTIEQAKELVVALGDSVSFYKIGLGLIFDKYWELFDWLTGQGKKAFADIKIYDIPETVEASVKKLVGRGVSFATVHAHENMIRAAVRGRGEHRDLKILAVTVLTSLDSGDLREMGVPHVDVKQLVLARATRMLQAGCDGVISSGLEVSSLRQEYGDNFLIVVPGIRPVENRLEGTDDQKRVVDVETAFRDGADYVVVGRPIRSAADRRGAAVDFQARIAKVFASPAV
ncbi:MAG: orotidine-5'-phosphate decarboxylase [Acidobacteriota bacterium]